jgi:XTP/dITP diphosphohydrolase
VNRSALGGKLLVASHNAGKVAEIEALLAPLSIEILSAAALGLAEPEETGMSFAENALLKARAAAMASGLPALADDSGLEVEALGRDPGIYSARWAGPARDFAMAMRNVEEKLRAMGAATQAQRRAEFVCVLSLCLPDGEHMEFEGRVQGTLVWPPRGNKGFGYDPMFVPSGFDRTFGEMEPADKHGISHRAEAFRKFREFLA